MNFTGIKPSDLSLLNSLVITPLKTAGAKIWIYGSRARGDYKPFSDVDILIEKETSLIKATLSKVKEAIEESTLSLKIDFVFLDDLAKSYVENVLKERREI